MTLFESTIRLVSLLAKVSPNIRRQEVHTVTKMVELNVESLTHKNDKNIQMSKQMNYNDGESVYKRASGLIRLRKGQTEEEFQSQRNEFLTGGPLVQNHTFVTDYVEKVIQTELPCSDFSITEQPKYKREFILHGLERLYFQRDYEQCLEEINKIRNNINLMNPNLDLNAKKNKNLKRILSELNQMADKCIEKIHLQNQLTLEKTAL